MRNQQFYFKAKSVGQPFKRQPCPVRACTGTHERRTYIEQHIANA